MLEKLNALEAVQSNQSIRKLAVILLIILFSFILCLFLPWQQQVNGTGKVTVFSPMDRPQNIEAQISGRIIRWHVLEGQKVKAGELLAELEDVDPKFLDVHQLDRMQSQMNAMHQRRNAAYSRASALTRQLNSLIHSQNVAIPSAKQRVDQAKQQILAAEQAVTAATQNVRTTELNLRRLQELHQKGLRSKRDLELAELANISAQTELQRASASRNVNQSGANAASFDQSKVLFDTSASINSIEAAIASAHETISGLDRDIESLEIDLNNVKRRVQQRQIIAPRDGRIVRLAKLGSGETVKAGDILAIMVPITADQAVELYMTDFDTPLVSVGRPVRLQFDGFPAIQFIGWPSIAAGTFGGRVAVIDAVDDGNSRFRVLVKPDYAAIKAGRDQPWPSSNFLRPGGQVTGWIMLDTVSLGWELWRQFNGFPATVKRQEMKNTDPEKQKTTGFYDYNKPPNENIKKK